MARREVTPAGRILCRALDDASEAAGIAERDCKNPDNIPLPEVLEWIERARQALDRAEAQVHSMLANGEVVAR